MRLPVNHALPLAALVILAGCSGGAGDNTPNSGPPPFAANGPAADYPVRIGEPFTIEGTTYTPVDKLNFDTVGYAVTGSDGGAAISIAHKTLPLPSYAEVTSLDNGKTILARVERRGPMTNDRLIELSPGAAAQLGVTDPSSSPIRIRRVNPPEVERNMLRAGQTAPARMDTPPSLLAVLKRKLDPQVSAPFAVPGPGARPGPALRPVALPRPAAAPDIAPARRPYPVPAASSPASGSLMVQVGAFGSRANAAAVAARVGGQQWAHGSLIRVVLGPFASLAAAEAALAKARDAGYSDARIQRAD